MTIKARFTVHPDWIAERLEEAKAAPSFTEIDFLCRFSNENPLLRLAEQLGDEKIADIAQSVDHIEAGRGSRYQRVTAKQRFALASALLQRYGSLSAVLSAAFSKRSAA